MFESLNFPVGHPARDMYDTFWTEDGLVLPAHTSTMQNRAMKMFDLLQLQLYYLVDALEMKPDASSRTYIPSNRGIYSR